MCRTASEIFLNPGEFAFAGEEQHLSTLLGSCVAITLWHPALRVGGMCHYMIPSRGRAVPPSELDGCYADEAMRLFMRELARRGLGAHEFEAQMFGGAAQFPATKCSAALDIPRGNVGAGLRLLERYGFTLAGWHVGGTGSRRVSLDIATGYVALHHTEQVFNQIAR